MDRVANMHTWPRIPDVRGRAEEAQGENRNNRQPHDEALSLLAPFRC